MHAFEFDTALGVMYAYVDGEKLLRLQVKNGDYPVPLSLPFPEELEFAEIVKTEVAEYLAGERREFSVETELHGTEFQCAVWRELMKIPFGETRRYGEIALSVGRGGASRAVGNACGANPVMLVVPCHRVVAARGIGGFACGSEMKERLLLLESDKSDNKEIK